LAGAADPADPPLRICGSGDMVGGTLGIEAAARSAPDGATFAIISTNHAINETLHIKQPYRLLTDLATVAAIDRFPLVVGLANAPPVRTLAEFIDHARALPGALSYSTSGPGSFYHLVSEQSRAQGGYEMEHVPYRNYAEARTALIGNRNQLMLDAVFTLAPPIKAGQVRGLVATGSAPAALLPDLPLVSATYHAFEAALSNGMVTPAEFGFLLAADVARQAAALRQAGVQPE
jgi:tripartite-type tricarboxylate transporter receptor subunit TctC